MHEYSIVQGLISQVRELQHQNQADRIVSVRLIVGEFSGVEPELLKLAFDILTKGTLMEGASLEIRGTELSARCLDCQRTFVVERFRFVCPACASTSISVEQGEELILESLTFASREQE